MIEEKLAQQMSVTKTSFREVNEFI